MTDFFPRECSRGDIDVFYILGPSIQSIVRRFCQLTGFPVMLPRYALGYLGSTMFYTELAKECDLEILRFIEECDANHIPGTLPNVRFERNPPNAPSGDVSFASGQSIDSS